MYSDESVAPSKGLRKVSLNGKFSQFFRVALSSKRQTKYLTLDLASSGTSVVAPTNPRKPFAAAVFRCTHS